VDLTPDASIAALGDRLGPVDHVVSTASARARGRMADLDRDAVRASFDTKVTGPLTLAKHLAPRMNSGGSFVLSGRVAAGPAPSITPPGTSGTPPCRAGGRCPALVSRHRRDAGSDTEYRQVAPISSPCPATTPLSWAMISSGGQPSRARVAVVVVEQVYGDAVAELGHPARCGWRADRRRCARHPVDSDHAV
jgi:NAD(P)-dependent dehydrogenase (short-subunit alcohol dehydrogenase family)